MSLLVIIRDFRFVSAFGSLVDTQGGGLGFELTGYERLLGCE